MKLVVVQCSTPDCTNTFDHSDSLSEDELVEHVFQNGWTKNADGTWSGCSKAEACPCVVKSKKEKS
jgi:hypothetical protein